jgi:hypothetical protein
MMPWYEPSPFLRILITMNLSLLYTCDENLGKSFVHDTCVDRVEDTKIEGAKNNGTCIVSSTNIENGFTSVKFYV